MNNSSLRQALKRTWLGQCFRRALKRTWLCQCRRTLNQWLYDRSVLLRWERNGRTGNPPHVYKRGLVREYGCRFSVEVLIETGTYQGDMVAACRKCFSEIHSIELDVQMADDAQHQFSHFSHITIHQGDSAEILPRILSKLDRRALFWLDAHYSVGITAKGAVDTPIIQELQSIFAHPVKDHILLIDDARKFVGQNDYPTIQELKEFVLAQRPDSVFEVEHDIIRIYPALPMNVQ